MAKLTATMPTGRTSSRQPPKQSTEGFEDDPAGDHKGDRKFVASIARAFKVLRAFQPGQGPMGNNDIAVATGLPKATVTRLTHTLTQLGYLNRIGRLGAYELNPSLLALGYCVLSNIRAREIAHDHMQKLADFGDAMVALGSRDRLSMIYVDLCTSGSLRTLHLNVGSRVSMHNSAIGRAFLSGITPEEREYFYDRFKRELGREWKPMRARIENGIEQIKQRGFCLVDGEWQRDVRSVAAPLISADGDVVMAINCTSLTFNSSVERFEKELGPRLAHLCNVVSPMLRRT